MPVTRDGAHLVALRQVVSGGAEALIEVCVVGIEHGVHIRALQVRTALEEEIEEVPAPNLVTSLQDSLLPQPLDLLRRVPPERPEHLLGVLPEQGRR